MNDNKNIWETIRFSDTSKRVLDYLEEQKKFLSDSTSNVLKMDIETVVAYLDEQNLELFQLYLVYVSSEKLGNFRIKLFTVIQNNSGPEFPVKIYIHSTEKTIDDVQEDLFLDKLNEVLSDKNVQNLVLNLYRQSMT